MVGVLPLVSGSDMIRKTIFLVLAIVLSAGISTVIQAQSSGGGFEIVKSTIDAGGGVSAGGDFILAGTIGQPDAGLQTSSGGSFLISGGFWAEAEDESFSDGFEGT